LSAKQAGVLTAALAAVVMLLSGCGAGTGTVSAEQLPAPGGTPGLAPAASAPGPAPAPAVHALARSVPVTVDIPSIGVDAPLMRLGLNSDGTVQVPPIEANAPAGWYQGSPTPGQTGPSVILAHVTVGQFGNGVFLHLSQVKPGDRVEVRLQDGVTADFTVYRVETVSKADFPTSAVYGNVDRPELRLITCGGPRNSNRSGYLDNVLVFASLDAGQ
jgi:LPXTG-site transpeptidase (sortase) family protein